MDRESARLRRCQAADLDDLYRICLETADSGGDGTGLYSRPRLPGDVYMAPYTLFEPSLALVTEDNTGVGGYIVGARDSRAFEQLLERDWWPTLRARCPEPPPGTAVRIFAMSLSDPAAGPACQDGWRGDGAGVPRPPRR